MALTGGWLSGVVAFLAVGAGGINVPTPLVRPQFIVLLLVVATVGLLTRHQGQLLLQPLLLSAGGTILTILDLLMRGPGDWASGSDTVQLSSFPLIVMGIAISLAIVQVTALGRSLPRGRPSNTSA
jgi:hypothetical protein